MIITKEQQEAWVRKYISEGHFSLDKYIGFTDGIQKAFSVVNKEMLDKQLAILFAQSLTNHEVTEGDLIEFLNKQ
jgi:hypothetical protein